MKTFVDNSASAASLTFIFASYDITFRVLHKTCTRYGFFGIVKTPALAMTSVFFGLFAIRVCFC